MLLDDKIKFLKKINNEKLSFNGEYGEEIQDIIYELDDHNEELIEELKIFLVNDLKNIEAYEIDLRMLSYDDDIFLWFINEFKDKINVKDYLTAFADGVEDDLHLYSVLIKNDIYIEYCDINECIEVYGESIMTFNDVEIEEKKKQYILNYNKKFMKK